MGLARRIVLRTPSFLGAPWMIADSDVALTVPRLLAERIAPLAGLSVADVPLDLGRIPMSQVWHARRHKDPAHVWLREIVAAEARILDRGRTGARRRGAARRGRPS
jgi:DNA-binding transcriptional LysR family regulator